MKGEYGQRRGIPVRGEVAGARRKGDEARAWEQEGWVRHMDKGGPRGEVSFILSDTNQNMSPGRDVTPSPGGRGNRQPAQDERERCQWTRWKGQVVMGVKRTTFGEGAAVCV